MHGTRMPKLAEWNSTAPAYTVIAVDLMPIGTGVVRPQLAGIKPELQWVSDDRSLVTLAKSLVDFGIGAPEGMTPSRQRSRDRTRGAIARSGR